MTGTADMVGYDGLDVLKYLARRVRRTVDWTTDCLSDKDISGYGHSEIEALCQMADEMERMLGPLAEAWNHYSDGREVRTRVDIEYGHIYEHLWHPDPEKNKPQVLTGKLLADPGQDNGTYEIRITPPGSLEVRTFPPRLRLVTP